ncbi:MAG: tRNA pseudouridine(55) synthase TruB [Candidatus Eremiobacteraeota bacterium]|nr:tRNA pseudouridine(55) synthase TruB [Candidatus Eremiobacteraeota bacterium]
MIGFVNVFKPAGPTSAQVVARIRRIFSSIAGDRKITAGHLGTLDPQAAGVLPVAVGKATRLIPLLGPQRKSYVCLLVVGKATTTGDALGATTATAPIATDWQRRLPSIVDRFIGQTEQRPPMFSALKHRGRRLYDLAREGTVVERKPRRITIYALNILGFEGERAVRLRIACSEGTYIRTVCEDIGGALGIPAHMGALLREGCGPFVLFESRTMAEVAEDPAAALTAPEHIIPFPTVVLDLRGSADFRAGRAVAVPAGAHGKHVFVRDETRMLVGIGEMHGALLAPQKVFV